MNTRTATAIFGIRAGNAPGGINEELLSETAETPSQIEAVKKAATADGWHHIRVAIIDMATPPDFRKVIRI
jgi:hypothetical protein